jgi:anti-sigma regulatory factor (Ser/Thr protein kinase)
MEQEARLREVFPIAAGDFTTAGEASATIKRTLKRLGVDVGVLRHVSVACYEVELNLIIHSLGGSLTLEVDEHRVRILSEDIGPGIPDIELAMREGYSTASEEARSLGFGAGMGLANMRRNADEFEIRSTLGAGTSIAMGFAI